MHQSWKFRTWAGSRWSLPILLFTVLFLLVGNASSLDEASAPAFHELKSSCIDLGHYAGKTKELTVHFVGKKPGRFYRYSSIPVSIWDKLNQLNETGGVGEYFNETVIRHPEKYPFKEIAIRSFTTIRKNKKAEDSK